MKRIYAIESEQDKREMAQRIMDAPFKKPFTIVAAFEDDRTNDQNAKMWVLLREIAAQVPWDGKKLPPEAWKDLFSAHLHGQTPVSGLEGGLVFLGRSTSRMSKHRLSEMIEFILYWGQEHNVKFKGDV